MRTRSEIERFLDDTVSPGQEYRDRRTIRIIAELLLDIRDQNAALLSISKDAVENERDAILKSSSVGS